MLGDGRGGEECKERGGEGVQGIREYARGEG